METNIKFLYVGKGTKQGKALKERIVYKYIFTQRQLSQNTYQALVWLLWPLGEERQGPTFFFEVELSRIWTPEHFSICCLC